MNHESFTYPDDVSPQTPELAVQVNRIYEDPVAPRVNEIYREIGAVVVRSVSYAGEDPTLLRIKEPAPAMGIGL